MDGQVLAGVSGKLGLAGLGSAPRDEWSRDVPLTRNISTIL